MNLEEQLVKDYDDINNYKFENIIGRINMADVREKIHKRLLFIRRLANRFFNSYQIYDKNPKINEKLAYKIQSAKSCINQCQMLAESTPVLSQQIVQKLDSCIEVLILDSEDLNIIIIGSIGDDKEIFDITEKSLANFSLSESKILELDKKSIELKELIEKAEEVVLTNKVKVHAEQFGSLAENYRSIAKKWMWVASISVVITAIVIFLFSYFPPTNLEGNKVYLFLSSKIFSIITTLSIAIWSGKVYKANTNLAAIYEHKEKSLRTFQEFIKAANEPQTKDFVLQETTRAIFSMPSTGFADNESLPIESTSKIFEIIKSQR